jgi:hypothetical protein
MLKQRNKTKLEIWTLTPEKMKFSDYNFKCDVFIWLFRVEEYFTCELKKNENKIDEKCVEKVRVRIGNRAKLKNKTNKIIKSCLHQKHFNLLLIKQLWFMYLKITQAMCCKNESSCCWLIWNIIISKLLANHNYNIFLKCCESEIWQRCKYFISCVCVMFIDI